MKNILKTAVTIAIILISSTMTMAESAPGEYEPVIFTR